MVPDVKEHLEHIQKWANVDPHDNLMIIYDPIPLL